MKENVTIRPARADEAGIVLQFIRMLAEYEQRLNQVEATEEMLRQALFERHEAHVVFAEHDGIIVGFALYFFNFSTFVGRKGLYLEDLFVLPEQRGKGFGIALLRHLATEASKQGCGRMEWVCLDWNQPSIDFYLSLHASPMTDWTVYRLDKQGIKDLAQK